MQKHGLIIHALFAVAFLFSINIVFAADPIVYQGDTLIIPVAISVESAIFAGQSSDPFLYQGLKRIIFGVPATLAPGNYNLHLRLADGGEEIRTVIVNKKKFPVIELPVPKKLQMTPKQLVTNLETVNGAVKKEVETKTKGVFFTKAFGLPLYDNHRIVSVYGELRRTGDETIRHLGTDFGASLGAPVVAINSGVVKKSYLDSIYGNSIIIDHGQGIYTLYLHLNERRVKDGDKVGRGEIIGTVGDSGYSSAPHLHLSVKINGISVDPLRFVRAW